MRKRHNARWPWKRATRDGFHDSAVLSKASAVNRCSSAHICFDGQSSLVRCGCFRPTGLAADCLVWQVAQRSKKLRPTLAQSDQNAASLVWGQVESLSWFELDLWDRSLYSARLHSIVVCEAARGGMAAERTRTSQKMWVLFCARRKWTGCFFLLFPGKRKPFPSSVGGCQCSWTTPKSQLTTWKRNKAQTTGLHVPHRCPGLFQ